MNRAKFAMLAALAAAGIGFLAQGQPAAAAPFAGPATAALSAIHLSDSAMALAGLAVLVCSTRGACAR